MVTIRYSREFKKHFRERIHPNKEFLKAYKDHLQLFTENRDDLLLNDHGLRGRLQGARAFNVTGDIRVIYKERGVHYFVFLDIGTHAQVYGL